MSKSACLTLEKTYLFEKNNVFIRYEVYTDKSSHSFNVAKILVTQEDEKSRHIIDNIEFDWQEEQRSGFQTKVGSLMNPGPLQVASTEEYCSGHFQKNYSN